MNNVIAALIIGASIITGAVLNNWDTWRPLSEREEDLAYDINYALTRENPFFLDGCSWRTISSEVQHWDLRDQVAEYVHDLCLDIQKEKRAKE
jgi:hypothetical protein